MRISDWSSDVCSSDLPGDLCVAIAQLVRKVSGQGHARVGVAGNVDRPAIIQQETIDLVVLGPSEHGFGRGPAFLDADLAGVTHSQDLSLAFEEDVIGHVCLKKRRAW